MKSIFTRASLFIGLAAILTASAFAQTNTPTPSGTDNAPMRGRMGRRGGMERQGREGRGGDGQGGERRALRRLNLTEAQQQSLRGIEERYGQSFKAQREELRGFMEIRRGGGTLTAAQQERARTLREQMRDNAARMRDEIRSLLTPEQQEQLKRMREEGHARRKARRDAPGTPDDNQ
jgi:Spy/CpxP family protein refolding chaperone